MSIINVIESQFSDDNNNSLKPERRNSVAAAYHDHSHHVSFFKSVSPVFGVPPLSMKLG
jgi:hypothetical protein